MNYRKIVVSKQAKNIELKFLAIDSTNKLFISL
jgi:hypothetical protein